MTEKTYDVLILGGGSGGVAAAVRAAQLGAKTALVEESFLGGLCMNRGCVPFGHMMAASHILGSLGLGREMGIECPQVITRFDTLLKRQNELVSFLRQGVHGMLNKKKITVIPGRGKLAGPGKVEVKGEVLSATKIILAPGSRWVKPDFAQEDLPGVVTSDYLLSAKSLPRTCLVFGEGPRAIEIAQFLHRFDTRVTLATQGTTLLPSENKSIRSRLQKALQVQGINLLTRAEISSIRKTDKGLEVLLRLPEREETLRTELVITLRRKACTEDLGLDTVGIDPTGGYLPVNEHMETGIKDIYAIGDMTAPEAMHYSHLASAGGIVAAENAMGMKSAMDHRSSVRVTYTRPQTACVGLTGKEAKEAGYDVVVGGAPLSMNPLGMILAQNEGLVEVVADRKFGELLGVHFIGEGAAEMAGMGVLAIRMEATLEELSRAVFPHPSLSESLAEAARDALGRPIYLP